MAGLWLWTLLSIGWAAAPDLAWLDANRTAIAVAALAAGLALGALIPRAGERLALGLSAAALAPIGWALTVAVFPEASGSSRQLARLSEPLGYWNALALVAAFAMPGALALASKRRLGRATVPLAAAWIALLATTGTLTLSRGGMLAFAVAALVTLAALPRRGPACLALVAGIAGAALPVAFGLTDDSYRTDGLTAAARADAGLALGWRLAVGVAVAVTIVVVARRLGWRAPRVEPGRIRAGLSGLAILLALGLVVAVALSASVRGGLGDDASGVVGNSSSRFTDLGANNRPQWWGEAIRGFAASPLAGHGGGGFELVHLQERPEDSADAFIPGEPHQVELRLLSGLGLVGLALFLAVLGGVAWGALRARAAGRGEALGLPTAIAVAFLVQAQVDWSFAIPALIVPAAAAAGVILARAEPAGPERRGGRRDPLTALALVAVTSIMIGSALLPWLSESRSAAANDALLAGDPELAIDRARAARSLNPYSLNPLLIQGAAYADLRDRSRELGAYREMTRIQPDNPRAWSRFAVALGPDPRAAAAWREVLRLNPGDRRARAEQGLP